MKFRIIGNGAFGTALSKILKDNLLEDSLHDVFAPIFPDDVLVPAVPSDVMCLVIEKALKFGKPKAIMIVSKGMANNQLLSESAKQYNLPLLYFAGPNLAKEIMENTEYISATLAGPKNLTDEVVAKLDNLILDTTEDIVIAQVAAFMKNVTAFVIGYLNLTQNARATLIMQGMQEAVMLAKRLGSSDNNYLRGCFSDFILTCTSEHSRNFQGGKAFREGAVKNDTQESLKSIDSIMQLKGDLELPIVDFLYQLVHEPQAACFKLK